MRRPRIRFTTRRMILLVALVGLNLAGAIVTSRFFPRPDRPVPIVQGMGGRYVRYHENGHIEWGVDDPITRTLKAQWIVWPLPRPTLLGIWSPVIASVAITLLVLVFAKSRSTASSHIQKIKDNGEKDPRKSYLSTMIRLAIIGLALIGLNLAAANYRPPDAMMTLCPNISGFVLIRDDGSLHYYRDFDEIDRTTPVKNADGTREYLHHWDRLGLPRSDWEGRRVTLGTIVFGIDGSIVGYEGSPGQTRSRPIVLRPPTYSPLEMWAPVIGSTSITGLFLLRALRRVIARSGSRIR